MTLDNYAQTYGAGEASEAIVDIIIKIIVGFVAFGTLIALIFLYGWFKKKTKMGK